MRKSEHHIAIIGGGAAGLMAAEKLSAQGYGVSVFERKPSVGRKILMAGRGGLNLTHSETLDDFVKKYGAREDIIAPMIRAFTPQDLRDWCEGLGESTFIGSSGRVFPKNFKASPLMRAWIARLERQGVVFHLNHDWQGWDHHQNLIFKTPQGSITVTADAVLLALGGASWPRLGADGGWVDYLAQRGVPVVKLRPSNCGFTVSWSALFSERFAGKPLKPVALPFQGQIVQGEAMITHNGIEGGAIYALSAVLRDEIDQTGHVILSVDLKPGLDIGEVTARLKKPRGGKSFSQFLRKTLNLSDVATGLLMEREDRAALGGYRAEDIAAIIKAYPLKLNEAFSIDRAISSAGGVSFDAVDDGLMLKAMKGVFVAGEMLDWEAPTGGYLLQACMAGGVHVANAIDAYMQETQKP